MKHHQQEQLFDRQQAERAFSHPKLHLGTSSWTAKGWAGTFYPRGTKPADYIAFYSTVYDTVEIDATFYATPRESTILNWRDKTPEQFIFAAKAPQTVTHDKMLVDCHHEMHGYLTAMSLLGDKLGPILFQFPYFAKRSGMTEDEFLVRLERFLKTLPESEFQFAVEIRNKQWMNAAFFEILHAHNVACCLIDHPWMSGPDILFHQREVVTGPFVYIRWLGDRKGIEKITQIWNESVVDREQDLAKWTPHIKDLLDRGIDVFGYINNHYGGYAPDNLEQLRKLLAEQ